VRLRRALMLVAVATCIASCDELLRRPPHTPPSPTPPTTPQPGVDDRVKTLERQVAALQKRIGIFNRAEFYDFAMIAPSESGFQVVRHSTGLFFLSVERWEPYANGYRLHMKIGNPMAADYSNVTVSVEWGDERSETKLPGRIRSHTWNPASIVVAPLAASEISTVTVKLDAPTVHMN
jgi:hypothetical protein